MLLSLPERCADITGCLSSGLFELQLCNVGAWTVMASAATRMGILEVAAHQLMLSLWLVIAFVQGGDGAALCNCLRFTGSRFSSSRGCPYDGGGSDERVHRAAMDAAAYMHTHTKNTKSNSSMRRRIRLVLVRTCCIRRHSTKTPSLHTHA